jgi:quercetin dioxygenase-like cupin family protein
MSRAEHGALQLARRGPLRLVLLAGATFATASIFLLSIHTGLRVGGGSLPETPVQATAGEVSVGPQSQRLGASVRTLTCEKLPNVPGKSITTALVTFPPGAYSPRHRHPGSVMAYVLKGTLRSQLAGEPARTYTAGQTWFEPPGAVHLFAENASSTEPAELLATFIADDDCGPLTIPD